MNNIYNNQLNDTLQSKDCSIFYHAFGMKETILHPQVKTRGIISVIINSKNKDTSNAGFTLIEVLISAALLVILAGGFLGMQYIFSKNQTTAWNNYLNIEDSNIIVSKFIKEIRDAKQSEAGTYFLAEANDNEIIFYSDIDYDDDVERVRYTLSSNNLIKGVIEPVTGANPYNPSSEKVSTISNIVRNGSEPLFYYYNDEWPSDIVNNPLALASRIANTSYIKIILKVNPKQNDSDNDFIIESATQIRFLKTSI